MFDEDKHFTYENLNLFQTIKEKLIIRYNNSIEMSYKRE